MFNFRHFLTVGYNCTFSSGVLYSTWYAPVGLVGTEKYPGERIKLVFILMSICIFLEWK